MNTLRVTILLFSLVSNFANGSELQTRGEYLAKISGCTTCHTAKGGEMLAGGREFKTPFGQFFSPNITPDKETGIASWSNQQFLRALRHGRRPDGKNYFPAFPYPSFTKMSTDDILAIKAYLDSVPAVQKINRVQKVKKPFNRFAVNFWKALYFRVGPTPKPKNMSALYYRGAYLVEATMHCAECHTPRDKLGGPRLSLAFAGAQKGFTSDKAIPNVTRDEKTGLGAWSKDDYLHFFKTGETPDGDNTSGEMKDVIKETTSLTDGDQQALVEYMLQIKAVENKVE